MIIYLMIGIGLGLLGVIAFPLSEFIKKIEDGKVCEQCNQKKDCFARKPIRKDSNYVSEFMLFSYCRIRKYCRFTGMNNTRNSIGFVIVNILLTLVLFWSRGFGLVGILYCIATAALLSLAVVDWNTQYIPLELSGVIFICGLIRLFAELSNWLEYVIGLIAVSGFLLIVNLIATPIFRKTYEGEQEISDVIGGGDIKLMAATGLLLGWKLNFFALGIACIAGSVIHLILMKIKGSDRQFALGPYLSLGVYITMICGEQLVSWYLNMMGVMPV